MLLAILLFMIGQALNMGAGYWIIWGIWLFFSIIGTMLRICKNLLDEED